MTHTGETNHKM